MKKLFLFISISLFISSCNTNRIEDLEDELVQTQTELTNKQYELDRANQTILNANESIKEIEEEVDGLKNKIDNLLLSQWSYEAAKVRDATNNIEGSLSKLKTTINN